MKAAAFLLAMLLSSHPVHAADAPTLGGMKLHLIYEETGRLSPDLLVMPDFTLWNTIIGEGSAEENANDALLLVLVKTDGEQLVESPLHLVVRDEQGKVLGERLFGTILTSNDGRAWMPLYIRDVGCAGPIEIVAKLSGSEFRKSIDFACGE